MKCAKEIKAAAKVGGPNPDANPRLKAAIKRALQNNLSRDSIQKNINGASKDSESLKEIFYEGYGPKGIAIIVKALTDNEQKTLVNYINSLDLTANKKLTIYSKIKGITVYKDGTIEW